MKKKIPIASWITIIIFVSGIIFSIIKWIFGVNYHLVDLNKRQSSLERKVDSSMIVLMNTNQKLVIIDTVFKMELNSLHNKLDELLARNGISKEKIQLLNTKRNHK